MTYIPLIEPVLAPVVAPIVEEVVATLPIVQDDDPRLSDARTPLPHGHAESEVTGLVSDLAGLAAAVSGKEPGLGNPGTDGHVLSSTVAGVRSWVPQSGGGGGSATRIVVNASFPASRNKRVNVVDAAVSVGSKVLAWVSGLAESDPNSGDMVDVHVIRATAKAGSFDLDLDFLTPWAGSLSIDYTVFA